MKDLYIITKSGNPVAWRVLTIGEFRLVRDLLKKAGCEIEPAPAYGRSKT